MGRRQAERLTRPGNEKDGLHSAPSLHGSCPSGAAVPCLPLWEPVPDSGAAGRIRARRGQGCRRRWADVGLQFCVCFITCSDSRWSLRICVCSAARSKGGHLDGELSARGDPLLLRSPLQKGPTLFCPLKVKGPRVSLRKVL